MSISLNINGRKVTTESDPETPLLWFIRDEVKLVGTKFGCGIAQCGACTVHLDGIAIRACITSIEDAEGSEITTIEGLSDGKNLTPLQQAWIDLDVPQCGYCQAGQLMSASALLADNNRPSDEDIEAAMAGNICRCGTYPRIKAAIKAASKNEL